VRVRGKARVRVRVRARIRIRVSGRIRVRIRVRVRVKGILYLRRVIRVDELRGLYGSTSVLCFETRQDTTHTKARARIRQGQE
jgi:hypothetical protein